MCSQALVQGQESLLARSSRDRGRRPQAEALGEVIELEVRPCRSEKNSEVNCALSIGKAVGSVPSSSTS